MDAQILRILLLSTKNHSASRFRMSVVPGLRRKMPKPTTACCSTSTTGYRRAEIRETLKFVRLEVQSPPPPAPPLAPAPAPGAPPAAALGFGPAVWVPFSFRVQPACA